ncbi:MAG: winged helix-turn-helix transcriptional regulator [Alphaproteobacteria bacterium]|nr:winged helix-turn-helix transcriptional regulator [Alphaproteobacteria bacterium]
MDIQFLVKLTSRAWSVKILALMHDGVPGRQAPLLAASGASRTAFAQSLEHLTSLGLLERNPGHGHPLRPEFRLTAQGVEIASTAYRIEAAAPVSLDAVLLRRMWTIPVLAVTRRPKFFTEIKRDLAPVTDRALSNSLQQLHKREWIARQVNVEMRPPRPFYQVVNDGARISDAVDLAG